MEAPRGPAPWSFDSVYGSFAGQPGYPSEARYATRLLELLRRRGVVGWNARSSYLDLGCGLGFKTRALAESFATACGVDASPTAIELATRLNDLDRLEFRQLDVEREELGSRFDVVTCFGLSILNTWEEERFAELVRSLTDRFVSAEGTLVVVDQSDFSGATRDGWVNHTPGQIRRMCSLIGNDLASTLVFPARDVRTYLSFGAEHTLREFGRIVLRRRRDCCFVVRPRATPRLGPPAIRP